MIALDPVVPVEVLEPEITPPVITKTEVPQPTKLDTLLSPTDALMSDVLNPSIHKESIPSELNEYNDPPLL